MSMTDPPALTVVPPGGGRSGFLGSIGVVFKLWGEQTGGALSVVEHPFPVGALVGPHMHSREDEYSIVTAGEIGFRSSDREVVLAAWQTREPAPGFEPGTARLQVGCAASCAMPAGRRRAQPRGARRSQAYRGAAGHRR